MEGFDVGQIGVLYSHRIGVRHVLISVGERELHCLN
jgi:hypothetical protein